jgi:hypothetical protein
MLETFGNNGILYVIEWGHIIVLLFGTCASFSLRTTFGMFFFVCFSSFSCFSSLLRVFVFTKSAGQRPRNCLLIRYNNWIRFISIIFFYSKRRIRRFAKNLYNKILIIVVLVTSV